MKDANNLLPALKKCCEALDGKKAESLCVLDLTGKSTITDYMIIATANSEPHLRALRRTVEEALDSQGCSILGTDYQPLSGWLVVDGFDFMVHLFIEEKRSLYQLESLWKDGTPLNWQKL
jgi:ribosome-associated protein